MTEKPQEGNKADSGDTIEIVYYTDPLCCWSWAFEPQWRKLRYEFEGKLVWKYCMGGLIPDWNSFNDPMNVIARPSQMGPLWMEAKHISGMPIDDSIWFRDPPSSSYPSCIAVKAAELQSSEAGERMLRKLREAVMIDGKNISKNEIIFEIASLLNDATPGVLDIQQFEKDFKGPKASDAFRTDIQNTRYQKIGRFPTLTLKRTGQRGIVIVGYRPYQVLLQAISQLGTDLKPSRPADITNLYADFWPGITKREKEEMGQWGMSNEQ